MKTADGIERTWRWANDTVVTVSPETGRGEREEKGEGSDAMKDAHVTNGGESRYRGDTGRTRLSQA